MRFTFNRNSDDMLVKLCSTSNWTESVPPNSVMSSLLSWSKLCLLSAGRLGSGWVTAQEPGVDEELFGPPLPPGWFIWGSLHPQDFDISHLLFSLSVSSQAHSIDPTSELYDWTASKKKKKRQDFTMAHTHTHRQAVTALQRSDTSMLQGCCI